ncbi:MAG: hypothetical protein Q8N05_22770 [Bacteroidota bacterium]|nr:hypothetical protein [Bacteroidota bacterium]
MDHHQIEKNGMYKKMLIFFADPINAAVWATFARLVTEIANFVSLNNSLTNYLQQQHADIKGVTQTKNDAFMAMVNIVVNKAAKAYVWAVDTANANLMQIFDVQKSDFLSISETKAYNQIKNIRDALSANIASMASVQLTADDVTAVNVAITAYQNTIGTTGAAQTHKTEGTKGIDAVMIPIDKSLALIDKLIVSSYTASKPDMVKEYLANRALDKLPTHHSGLSIHITDAETGADLEGVILAVNGKTATSDIDGMAEIIKIMPGTYNMSVTLANYVTQTTKIVIEKGKLTELDVKMAKG